MIGPPVSQQEADSSCPSLASARVSAGAAGPQPTADDISDAVQSLVLLTVRFISQTSGNAALPEEEHFLGMLFRSLVFCIENCSSHPLAGVVAMSMACLAQACELPLDMMEQPATSKAVSVGMSQMSQSDSS